MEVDSSFDLFITGSRSREDDEYRSSDTRKRRRVRAFKEKHMASSDRSFEKVVEKMEEVGLKAAPAAWEPRRRR